MMCAKRDWPIDRNIDSYSEYSLSKVLDQSMFVSSRKWTLLIVDAFTFISKGCSFAYLHENVTHIGCFLTARSKAWQRNSTSFGHEKVQETAIPLHVLLARPKANNLGDDL